MRATEQAAARPIFDLEACPLTVKATAALSPLLRHPTPAS